MSDHPAMPCEEALRLLMEHLDGELHSSTQADLERHLDVCRSCYSRAEFERRLKARLAALGPEPITPHFSQRIRLLIERFSA